MRTLVTSEPSKGHDFSVAVSIAKGQRHDIHWKVGCRSNKLELYSIPFNAHWQPWPPNPNPNHNPDHMFGECYQKEIEAATQAAMDDAPARNWAVAERAAVIAKTLQALIV